MLWGVADDTWMMRCDSACDYCNLQIGAVLFTDAENANDNITIVHRLSLQAPKN